MSTLKLSMHDTSSRLNLTLASWFAKQRSWGSRVSLPTIREYISARRITPRGWLAFVLAIIAYMCTLTIFVAPGWGWTQEVGSGDPQWEGEYYTNYGLWYLCSWLTDEPERRYCLLLSSLGTKFAGWWRGCQALSIITLVLSTLNLVTAGTYVCSKKWNQRPRVVQIMSVLAIVTGLMQIALFVSFCVMFLNESYWCCPGDHQILEYHLYYCFIICPVAAVLHIVCGATASCERLQIIRDAKPKKAEPDYRFLVGF